MLNHVVIWQGEREQAEQLAAGAAVNGHKLLVVRAPEDADCFGPLTGFDLPEDVGSAEAWHKRLLEIHVAVATDAPAHAGPGGIVLNVVLSPSHCSGARGLLRALTDGAARIPGVGFSVHIILLPVTVSDLAGEQEALLLSFQADARGDGEEPLPWNRLSVLSDWSGAGAATPVIGWTRLDVLSGVIADNDETLPDAHHECVTYEVRCTTFRRSDVQLLPKHMLRDVIREHKESIADAREAFAPQLDLVHRETSMELGRIGLPLEMALLADDNNYRERSGRKVIEGFCQRNAGMLLAALEPGAWADQWLRDAKKKLAAWIDVDPVIRGYLQPGGALETEIGRMLAELDKARPEVGVHMTFGSQTPLGRRRKNARIAAVELCDLLVWQGKKLYLEAVRERLPQLSVYLKTMEEANDRLFGGFLPDLVHAFAETPWAKAISGELALFDMAHLAVPEQAVDDYGAWLAGIIRTWCVDKIRLAAHLHAESDFKSLALRYVENDPHPFVMLNKGFDKLTPTERSIICLGASTKLYRLSVHRWMICENDLTGVMLTIPVKKPEAGSGKVKDVHDPKAEKKFVDMKAELAQEKDHYTLKWNWPRGASRLELTVRRMNGELCYQASVIKKLHIMTDVEQIPISSLPQGERVLVRLEDAWGHYMEREQLVPRIERELRMQSMGGLALAQAMRRWSVQIPQEISAGVPSSRCVLELRYKENAFRYPVLRGAERMVILSGSDKEKAWQDARLVLEES